MRSASTLKLFLVLILASDATTARAQDTGSRDTGSRDTGSRDTGSIDLALIEASERGDRKSVRRLLNQGANVDAQRADGSTALSSALARAASSKPHRKIATMLLERGASLATATLARDARTDPPALEPSDAASASPSLSPGAHWTSFRGNASNGRGIGETPVEWNGVTGHNVLWKTEIPGLGHSSPVIWGDRIFVTTAVPDSGEASLKLGLYGDIAPVNDDTPQSWKVLALDKRSGEILWEQTAKHGVPEVKRHTKATHANPTPVTDGRHLVVSFGSEGIFTYDLDGRLLWEKDLGVLDSGFFRVPSAQWGFSSSPVLHDGKLILQVDVQGEGNSYLAAFDVTNGKELWRTPRSDVPTWSTPAVFPYTAGGRQSLQVVANGWKHIGGYDLETGKELWKLTGGGDIPVPTPLYEDGLILITSAHGPERPIYAIRTDASGDITDQEEAFAWRQDKAGNYMQTPLVYNGLGYFCQDNGVMSVYELETGERFHQARLGGGKSGFTGSPVAADGKVYFTSEDGDTYVLRAEREPEVLSVNELGETFMSSPAVSDGTLFFRARKHLFAIAELD